MKRGTPGRRSVIAQSWRSSGTTEEEGGVRGLLCVLPHIPSLAHTGSEKTSPFVDERSGSVAVFTHPGALR